SETAAAVGVRALTSPGAYSAAQSIRARVIRRSTAGRVPQRKHGSRSAWLLLTDDVSTSRLLICDGAGPHTPAPLRHGLSRRAARQERGTPVTYPLAEARGLPSPLRFTRSRGRASGRRGPQEPGWPTVPFRFPPTAPQTSCDTV